MSFARCISPAWRWVALGAGALLAALSASAQVAASASPSNDLSREAVASATYSSSNETYSSSNDWVPAADSIDPNGIPAAPAPAKPEGGGQYDNKSGEVRGWKNRLSFEFGGGFNVPSSDSSSYANTGANITVGSGMHFSHGLGVLLEYQFIDDGLPSAIVAEAGASGGNIHMWSFTVDPVVNLMPKRATSVYVTGGGGFYRKVTNFTDPQLTEYCYYFCTIGTTNAVVGHFSSNQGGWNVGGGVSHRFAGVYGDGRMAIYAEARYLDVLSPAVVGATPNGLGATTVGADTKLVPVTFGLRF
jgi:Outer membrane protein beta-barrel domain